jgi:hypothetical protein
MAIDDTIQRVKLRREQAAAKHTAKAAEGETNTNKFRILWDAACPEHPGAWGGTRDMMHAREKIAALTAVAGDLQHFLVWVAQEWHSLRNRTGTDWMAKANMLPRHPNMRFVLHHWTHFMAAYHDRERQKGHNHVDPEVDALREEVGFLNLKLHEAANFGQEAQLLKAKEQIKFLEKQNARLRATLGPLVDLDSDDLPTWEEKNAEV